MFGQYPMLSIRFITLSQQLKKYLTIVAVIVGLSYPFLVYFGMSVLSPQLLIVIILVLLGLRILIMVVTMPSRHRLIWPGITAVALMVAASFIQVNISVKLYPVAISVLLGAAFLFSVFRPPTIIEKIARMTEPDLDQKGVLYTRNVTLMWVLFFMFNAAVSAWTVLYGTLEQWTIYNGIISYCLTGLLFAGEFLVRRLVRVKVKS